MVRTGDLERKIKELEERVEIEVQEKNRLRSELAFEVKSKNKILKSVGGVIDDE
tara:strand:- start:4439 stop:4600 length:162 start_codon:yes stop_codon:yes gene_type:complete